MKRTTTSRRSVVSHRHPLVAATVLTVVAVLSGCSGNSSDSSPAAPAATTPAPAAGGSAPAAGGSTVEIKDFTFAPAKLTVSAGTSVSWKFDDSTQHTVTADDNSFMSAAMGDGQTYMHTFDTKGTLTYHCSIHPFMKGSVEVQ
jgi:plastocyanin